jgi:predicted nucleic acid-binding Zn ribbon protein
MTSKKYTQFIRKRVLQEWRGLPQERCLEQSSDVSEVLSQVIQKLGLKKRIQEEEIINAWHEVVGDFLAAHSTPFQLAHGALHVRVIQPSIRYELDRVWKPEILRKLQEKFGRKTIRDIKIGL